MTWTEWFYVAMMLTLSVWVLQVVYIMVMGGMKQLTVWNVAKVALFSYGVYWAYQKFYAPPPMFGARRY